jgi:ubiquinone biosynthesis protein
MMEEFMADSTDNKEISNNNLSSGGAEQKSNSALDKNTEFSDTDSFFDDTISENNITDFTDNSDKSNRERLKQIISILGKHKAIESLITSKHPERIKDAFEELGPTFIKMGQMLSTRPDLIPEALAEEFKKLQDDVKTDDFPVVKSIIENSYNVPINEVFKKFDEIPVASASMAQVHAAVLMDGSKVAVKIQHAGIKTMMLNDIALFEKALPFFKIAPTSKVIDPAALIKELKKSCENELDFTLEAKNIHLFYRNNSNLDYMDCLKAYPEYAREDILVMDFVSGIKITDVDALKAEKFNIKSIAQNLVNNYMKQAFEDGFFHADPHPGNIVIRNGKITFLDFGMMGIMSDTTLKRLNDVLYSIYIRDTEKMTDSVLKLCIKKGKVDKDKLNADIEDYYSTYIDDISLKNMNFALIITKLTLICADNNLSIPEEAMMFIRGLMNIVGVVEVLNPDITLISAIGPYMEKYMINKFNPIKEIKDYIRSIYTLGKVAPQIPVKFADILDKLKDGNLEVKIEHNHNNLEKMFNQLDYITNKIVIGMLLFALIVGSSILADSGKQTETQSIMSIIGITGYIVAAVFTVILIISLFRNKYK